MIRALIIGCSLLILSLSGMYAGIPDHAHDSHCPFSPASTALCATVVSHLEHWQVSISGVASGALLLIAALTILYSLTARCFQLLVRNQRMRAKQNTHPPLLVELFARGLLNPRVP
jgi:hypothetical protein